MLRDQAERCLRLARSADDQALADSLMARAADYLESAQALEWLAVAPSIALPTQPVQLQQQIQANKIQSRTEEN
jgi:hypothetical protein